MNDSLKKTIQNPLVLTEGAVIERLKREYSVKLDEKLLHSTLVREKQGRKILEQIYREYIELAIANELPIFIFTPTWKLNYLSCNRNEKKLSDMIHANCDFMHQLKSVYKNHTNIYIGGLIGVVNDSYDANLALPEAESYLIHKKTINEFGKNQHFIDFIIAATLPSLDETLGIARAISDFNIPYILSFVVRSNGQLIDNRFFYDAIPYIDNKVQQKPIGYMVNCTHPNNLYKALSAFPSNKSSLITRIIGIQGNTSKRSPEDLEKSTETLKEDPSTFANSILRLSQKYNLNIIGGCCGTDKTHLSAIASLFKQALKTTQKSS